MLVRALEQVLMDDSFTVNAPPTIQARKSAESLLQWCQKSENDDVVNEFARKLTESLKKVIKSSATKSFTYNTEKIWRGFFFLRSSQDFISQWTNFLKAAAVPVKPVLFQHLTDLVFREFLHDQFQVLHLNQQDQLN